mmetsp:Transcript_75114/g.242872  ORF Transcript_75114/g.242872 Transcript_75114/m.242872 type:complete len:81 (+) Transcript_75114:232-474(+)
MVYTCKESTQQRGTQCCGAQINAQLSRDSAISAWLAIFCVPDWGVAAAAALSPCEAQHEPNGLFAFWLLAMVSANQSRAS